MRDLDLFQLALGLHRPWVVSRSEFDASVKQLDLYIDFEAGGTFPCPECGGSGCRAYDTTEKTWRHLNFFEHQAFLHVRTPRVQCSRCGVKLVDVPWVRIPAEAGHRFRSKPATDSGGFRPPIPEQAGHRFRCKPAGHSGRCRPPGS